MPKPDRGTLVIRCQEKHPRYINGKEIPNWQQGPTVSEVVKHLTGKGWLLFSAPSALWLGEGELTFIRPEYLFMLCEDKHPRSINGKEVPNWRVGPTVSEAVNYLGSKGWSLFSDPSAIQPGYVKLTFIRPKE